MIQEYAKKLGYIFRTRGVNRVTWYKHKCGLAGQRGTHSDKLKKLRSMMIESGKIDIGRAIVPIIYKRKVFNELTQLLEDKQTTVYGRKIPLLKIRTNHLKLMQKKQLLRETPIYEKNATALKAILDQYKGKTLEELQLFSC